MSNNSHGGTEHTEIDPVEDELDLDAEITCWCGAKGTYEELFDDSGLDQTCGGLGVLQCHCGGDLCVCHHHSETECFGCPDCEEAEEDDWE